MATRAIAKKKTIEEAIFVWQGTDKRGVKVKGEMRGSNPNLIRAEVRRQGITPTKVKKKPKPLFTMGDSIKPTLEQYRDLQFTLRCINESMRLYPHPPVLLRRALVEDELPGGYTVPKDQDVMISVYNIHRSPAVWDDPHEFKPERFPVDAPPPTELNTDFRYARGTVTACMFPAPRAC